MFDARILHTTPPEPPDGNETKLRINSPVFNSHSLTVPSSDEVITKFELNCKQVTALKCLFVPANVCKQSPVLI